jgi:hypothetical protein
VGRGDAPAKIRSGAAIPPSPCYPQRREARTAAGLSHPNFVQVHAVEERGDLVFFVMAFVDGETLGARVRRDGPLPASDVMRVTQEVAWALAHAHARGVIHRDVKPENVLIDRESNRAMVTDFGIAREVESADRTPSGPILGTPQYMSPEQATAGSVDPRSDLYSLGVTVFFAATGVLPFEATSVAGYLLKVANEPAPKLVPRAPRLPKRFAEAIDGCLLKDPAARPASADALARDIEAARGALVRVPAPLERFMREADIVGGDVATFLGGALGSAVVFEILRAAEGNFLGILVGIELLFVTVFLGLSAARVTQILGHARELMKSGYAHHALRAGLELAERRDLEEERATPKHSRARPWVTAGAGVAITGLGIAAGIVVESDAVLVISLATAVGGPMLTIRLLWSQLGVPKWWRRLLKGRIGRWLFRVGGIGLKDRPEALPDHGERTEVVLGGVAEQLFLALPEDQRQRLGDVPTLVAKLEADALALRERAEEPQVTERLSATVAALETLRLDLLRLHAGNVTLDELTQNIEAAEQVRREIDRHLEAAREANDLAPE